MALSLLIQLYEKLNWRYVNVRSGMIIKRIEFDTILDKEEQELVMRKVIYMGKKFDYRQLYYDIIIKIDPKSISKDLKVDDLEMKDLIFENKMVYCIVTDKRYSKYGNVDVRIKEHYLPLYFWMPNRIQNKFDNILYNINQYK